MCKLKQETSKCEDYEMTHKGLCDNSYVESSRSVVSKPFAAWAKISNLKMLVGQNEVKKFFFFTCSAINKM